MEEEPVEDFFIASGKKVEQYVQDRILLLKLQATEKMARLVGLLFLGLIISLLLFFIILFLSYMAGNYFSEVTGSLYLGYAIVTGFYVFFFVIVLLSRKWINKKVMDLVIKIFFGKNVSDE
jgi:uncharacterized membrane protein YdjX (TVP38/TMEM64 family)